MVIKKKEKEINFKAVEEKWQKEWEKKKIFQVSENSKKKKYYVLEMFPYPSASGLHMGHAWNYTIGDIFARFKILQGFNVLHPMGYDALGLPAENAAIKAGKNPQDYTEDSIKNYIKQQKKLGLSYDWSRIVNTADPKYYHWDQWIFLKMFEKGLVYQKEAAVNWCPECKTILANEQVSDGKCWRHENTEVEIKQMNQWYLKITDYADRLLEGHKKLNWPEKTIAMQKNWIGKSYGTEIDFIIETPAHKECTLEPEKEKWSIFTTRPDTIFGVTFMVVSAQHKDLMDLVTSDQEKAVEKFLKKLKSVSEKDSLEMEKEGVFTGSYAINPANNEKVPVYIGNFVVADYGCGMVMAVPAHDQRDFEFAKKYNIPIKDVIAPVVETTIGPDAIQKDKPIHKRETVVCIVKHWKEDKYLCLNWKKQGWKTFVVGGIEKGEKLTDAGLREVKEETGYQNIKFIKEIPGEFHNKFFATHKNENREAVIHGLYFELRDSKQKDISKEEKELYDSSWVEKEKVLSFLHDDESDKILWKRLIGEDLAYTSQGILINSKEFNGLINEEAKKKITDWLISKKLARKTVNYKLRDWSVARQRYWGTPIPLIHCEKCGVVPVPEKDLPVALPKKVKFGEGNPLLTNKEWLNVKCPKCGKIGKREANTMDTFVNSSWYFLRYCDPKNDKKIFDKEKAKYWMPVDLYIGGAEHACMHLIYCRFYTMFLHDLGLIDFDEPAPRLFHQGMLRAEGGEKMSKSKGNVIAPEVVSDKYGIDTARFFLCSLASPDKDIDWDENGILGSLRFTKKVFSLENIKIGKDSEELINKLNRAIKNITSQIGTLDYRKSTIELRELFDLIYDKKEISEKSFEKSIKLLSPFCPHIAEELWHKLGNKTFISSEEWPEPDESKTSDKFEKAQETNDQLINDIRNIINIIKEKQGKEAKKLYLYTIPNELKNYEQSKEKIRELLNLEVNIFAVNDKNKYDPQNKASKSKPNKPAIYLE
jgi:leucyl-tRNA synthetase